MPSSRLNRKGWRPLIMAWGIFIQTKAPLWRFGLLSQKFCAITAVL